jgi:type III pantothenate kinase
MLLLVDAGNTRIKWAAVDPGHPTAAGQWTHFGMVARADIDTLAPVWQALGISHAVLSNVAGTALHDELEQALSHALGLSPVPHVWFKSQAELAGLRNAYRDPQQLGCDRFASAIGARALYPDKPLMIVTCGTATTIDCVSADGVFTGGMILPGLGTMAASLASKTAQLPQLAHVPQAVEIVHPFADNTTDAIVSGCINAQAGAVERAMTLYRTQHPAAHCLLSGGAALVISPHLSIPHDKVDNLVLIGLQTVAYLSEKPC